MRIAAARKQESVDGIFITVQNPITDATLTQIKNTIDRALNQPGRHIKKIVFDFNPGDSEAATPNYGSCHDFADYIKKLKDNGTFTVAFVHAKTYRHTVLPVLACNDLIMSTDAKIGEGRGTQRDRPSGYCRYVRPRRGPRERGRRSQNAGQEYHGRRGRSQGHHGLRGPGQDPEKDPKFDGVFVNENNAKIVLAPGTLGLYNLEEANRQPSAWPNQASL